MWQTFSLFALLVLYVCVMHILVSITSLLWTNGELGIHSYTFVQGYHWRLQLFCPFAPAYGSRSPARQWPPMYELYRNALLIVCHVIAGL